MEYFAVSSASTAYLQFRLSSFRSAASICGMHSTRLLFFLGFSAATALAQQRPLITEAPETIEDGMGRLELGVDFSQDQSFPLSGLQGDLTRLGVIGGRVGIGTRVEFQVQGTLGNFLTIKRRQPALFSNRLTVSGDSTSDVGDFLFATKVRLRGETARLPSFSFRVGTELPIKSNESGLGMDTARVSAGLLLGKHFGRTQIISNFGVAIIDNPTELASQSDKFLYGVAFIHSLNSRVRLLGEVHGMYGNPHPGTEDTSAIRLGVQIQAAGLVWDIAGLVGLREVDPDSGSILGITRDFQLFNIRKQSPP